MSQTPDEDPAARALDAYLQAIQSGQQPDREALLVSFPDLESVLRCLDALEGMASDVATVDDISQASTGFSGESPDSFPREFGPFSLLGELGRGGMGVVFKALQRDLDRVVALKMILPSHLASAEHVRRFQAEARAAARLRHPEIVPIYEVGQCAGQHYFTMEYIEGESLANRIADHSAAPPQQPRLSIAAGVRIVAAVARAVEHLHQQGVVHRDLKPSNILLDAEIRPYVTDFGLAKVFVPGSEVTATGVIAGTPSYMAPEQATGRNAEIGPAADIYSLGSILYELLTGRPPFREASPLDTLLAILDREPELPRTLNANTPWVVELICMKCLSKRPAARYESAAALAEDLERYGRGEPISLRPPNMWQRLGNWTRRKPALAVRLGALGAFELVSTVNFLCGGIDATFYENSTLISLIWAVASIVCQQFLPSERWSVAARYVWGTLDSLFLLFVLLFVAGGASSVLLIGYPLLIVGAGLWYRARYIWFVTALSLVSYGLLVIDFYFRRPELQKQSDPAIARHIIFAVSLVVLASIVAYLVDRLRTLSGFYGRNLQ